MASDSSSNPELSEPEEDGVGICVAVSVEVLVGGRVGVSVAVGVPVIVGV